MSLERDWDELLTTFKKNCYAAVQHVKGQVLNWYEPDIDISYAHAHVKVNNQELYIFNNGMYDYIAFTMNRLLTNL